jgi:hypothetical protein
MIFSENRRPLFGIMLQPVEHGRDAPVTRQSIFFAKSSMRSGWTRASSPRVTDVAAYSDQSKL